MKLYNSVGPNPKAVRMFMAERGIAVERVEVDLRGGENRREPYLSKNPFGQLPALELDDGRVITEITAICEYLDEIAPGASLVGGSAEERAEARMWLRRVTLNVTEPMSQGYRYSEGLPIFQNRVRCIPQAAADLKAIAQENLALIDRLMDGREFLCGQRLTVADVVLYAFLNFFARIGQPLNPELRNIGAWFERMKARPSAGA